MSFWFYYRNEHSCVNCLAYASNQSAKAAPEATSLIPRIPDFLLGQLYFAKENFLDSSDRHKILLLIEISVFRHH